MKADFLGAAEKYATFCVVARKQFRLCFVVFWQSHKLTNCVPVLLHMLDKNQATSLQHLGACHRRVTGLRQFGKAAQMLHTATAAAAGREGAVGG